ncbi:hypothetical protein GEMRC1_010027 [Eukaryota sp. GEM-RC1]
MFQSDTNLTFNEVTAQFILESLTIEALDVYLSTPTQADLLTKIVSSSKCRLRKLTIESIFDMKYEDSFFLMIVALANCNSIRVVAFNNSYQWEILAPIFSSSFINQLYVYGIDCRSKDSIDSLSSLFPLRYNSSLQELFIHVVLTNPDDIADILRHNTTLKRLKINRDEDLCTFTSVFNSLTSNSSLKELILFNRGPCDVSFEGQELEALCKMLRKNKSLLVLNLPNDPMNSTEFELFVEALKENQVIETVIFSRVFKSLSSFVSDCEAVWAQQLTLSIDFDPHYIDVQNGVFIFDGCCGSTRGDSEDGSSCVLSYHYLQIAPKEVSSLQSFVNRFSIKELTLKNCIFTQESTTVLNNLIRNNISLTSVDFSHDEKCYSLRSSSKNSKNIWDSFDDPPPTQSDDVTVQLIMAIQSNSRLKKINLNYNFIGLNSLLTVFEMVLAGYLIPNIQILPHSIDYSLGVICYESKVDTADLRALLNSHVPIKRVKCRGIKNLNIECLVTLIQVVSINNLLLSVDISPHIIDVEKGCSLSYQKV